MRLSESIGKGILETGVGFIVNKFRLKKRRDTFFFDDIGLEYVKILEENGYGEKLRKISYKWGAILYSSALPSSLKKLPYTISCNIFVKETFVNLGYLKDMEFRKEDHTVKVSTKGEVNIKKIGKNNLHTGMFMGMTSVFFDSDVGFVDVECNLHGDCLYTFKLLGKKYRPLMKDKERYNRLNNPPSVNGYTIKDALRLKILNMKDCKIYFRGKLITAMENTLFHLFSNANILMEEVSRISYDYFSVLVKESSPENKLNLIKNLLHFMGWGIVKFRIENKKSIVMVIEHPPFGLQKEEDNWKFLCHIICGYIRTINKGFRLKSVRVHGKKLLAAYCA